MIAADEPDSSDVMIQGPCGDPLLFPVDDSSNTTPAQEYHSPAILEHTSGVLGDHPYPNRALKTVPLQGGGGEFIAQVRQGLKGNGLK